ncbi:MAG TPA: ABC transporter permease [Desulfobacteraceae bacterium]|nr:ABC transporter permease [Desulfobacteraceae bacterium]
MKNILFFLFAFAIGAYSYHSGFLHSFYDLRDDLTYLTIAHMKISVLASVYATLIGVIAGVFITRPKYKKYGGVVIQVINAINTIPVLALLAVCMLFMGIGDTTAITGLALTGVIPILLNTYQGITEVSPALIEAAKGQGMTNTQILMKVELPNALFVIFAGVKTSFTLTVSRAPLAFLIGGSGLGEIIFTGIAMFDFPAMLVGSVIVAVLAVASDYLLSLMEYVIIPTGINPHKY